MKHPDMTIRIRWVALILLLIQIHSMEAYLPAASIRTTSSIAPRNTRTTTAIFNDSSSSGSATGGKAWWSTPYQPGRPDPFTAISPLGDDDNDEVITVPSSPTSSAHQSASASASKQLTSKPSVSVTKGSPGVSTSTNKNGPRKMVEIAPSPSDPFHYGSTESRNKNDRHEVPPPSRLPTTGASTSTNKNGPTKMVEINPSPSDPFHYGTRTGSRNNNDGNEVPPPSRLPTMNNNSPSPSDSFHYGTRTGSRSNNDRQDIPPPSRLPTMNNDNPSPTDPFHYGTRTGSRNNDDGQDIPPPSRLPTMDSDNRDYGQQAPRTRIIQSPPLSDDIYQKRRNNNRGSTATVDTAPSSSSGVKYASAEAAGQRPKDDIYEKRRNNNGGSTATTDAAPLPFGGVTYASADAVRQRPRNTDNLKSAAVPLHGSDEQTPISSDDDGMRSAASTTQKPRKVRRKTIAPIDTDIIRSKPSYGSDGQSSIPSPSVYGSDVQSSIPFHASYGSNVQSSIPSHASYGSDVQSSIPASTNAFFQNPPKRRQRKKSRKKAPASFESASPSFYTSDVYLEEDPSIQSVFPQRNSLPSQSGGSMSLSENSLPTRSNYDMQSPSSRPYLSQSNEQATFMNRVDFVDFLEARGMQDNGKYSSPMMSQQQQLQWQQRHQQQQQMQWKQQQAIANPAYQNSIITRAKNRTPPTKLDVAASTLGGSLLGASIGIAAVANPALGLNFVGQSAMLPPVLWATMIGTVGYAGGIADNDAGYSIRHVFSLGSSLKTGITNFVHSARETMEKTAHETLRMVSGQEDPPARMHHVTIKTRNIVSSMEFYGLLGFESKSKFRVGQARATWLDNVVVGAGRIELIEVPSDMLEQAGSSSRRALDRVRNQELLGWNHMTLDVSDLIRKKGFGSLSEFLAYLNEKRYNRVGEGLSLAVEPQKQAIDEHIYDTAFLYDPDGSMIQLQYLTNERAEDYRISSYYYGEPTGGQGLVDQSDTYQGWW